MEDKPQRKPGLHKRIGSTATPLLQNESTKIVGVDQLIEIASQKMPEIAPAPSRTQFGAGMASQP